MRRILTPFTTCVLAVTLVFGAFTPTHQVRADQEFNDAIAGAAGCAVGALVQAAVSALLGGNEVPVKDWGAFLKETVYDCAAWVFANILLEQMTSDVVQYANTGFDGNPAYVDDPNKLYEDAANEVTGLFIDELGLDFLCSPFELDIRLAIASGANRNYRNRATCTLSDVVENMEDFIDGDFSQGGWKGWFELTQKPQNNPYGAYFEAQNELGSRIATRIEKERSFLEYGQGFRTNEECIRYEELDGPPDPNADPSALQGRCLEWQVATPGATIKDRLSESLGSPQRRAEMADEVSEIIGALFAQLVTEALSGDGGLRSITPEDIQGTEVPDLDPVIDGIGDIAGGGGGSFDLSCPSDGRVAGSDVVRVTKDRFVVPASGGDFRIKIPLDGHYPEARITFDVLMGELLTEAERPIVNNHRRSQMFVTLRHLQDSFDGWFMYSEANAENTAIGAPGNRLGSANNFNKVDGPLQEGRRYSVEMNYNANIGLYTMDIADANTGAPVYALEFPIANSLYPLNGQGPTLIFDSDVINGTHNVSHVGAVYENIVAEFTPGEPVCNRASGGGSGGGNSGSTNNTDTESLACNICEGLDPGDEQDECRRVNSCGGGGNEDGGFDVGQ